MICPHCHADDNYVYGIKHTERGNDRRYRRCRFCGYRFKTIEYYVPDAMKVGAHKASETKRRRRESMK